MRVCVPIRENGLAKAKKQIMRANRRADLIEIWLDKIPAGNVCAVIKISKRPVIAVCRAKAEKGSFRGSEAARMQMLERAVFAGAQFVDVGIQTAPNLIKNLKKVCVARGAKLIISKHFWDSTPELSSLLLFFKKARKLGADIVKIATTVLQWSDNAVLFELTMRVSESEKNAEIIVVGMGARGKISRIGCPLLGSYLTYVALDEKSKTAPGQLTLREVLN